MPYEITEAGLRALVIARSRERFARFVVRDYGCAGQHYMTNGIAGWSCVRCGSRA
ncbi:MAG: hypothetical protein QOI54_1824 [Actinomycetota bacterium]|nr:hypothetical protein [Actinomycetota bacterium]